MLALRGGEPESREIWYPVSGVGGRPGWAEENWSGASSVYRSGEVMT